MATANYGKLLKLLIEKNIMIKDIVAQAEISTNAMANMGKDKEKVHRNIYETLNCQIEDIVEIEHTRTDSNP